MITVWRFPDLRTYLGIERTPDPNFFWEWQVSLPALSDQETRHINHLSERYLRYLEEGEVSEGTLNIMLLAPLLDGLGLCDLPYHVRGETWVSIAENI